MKRLAAWLPVAFLALSLTSAWHHDYAEAAYLVSLAVFCELSEFHRAWRTRNRT